MLSLEKHLSPKCDTIDLIQNFQGGFSRTETIDWTIWPQKVRLQGSWTCWRHIKSIFENSFWVLRTAFRQSVTWNDRNRPEMIWLAFEKSTKSITAHQPIKRHFPLCQTTQNAWQRRAFWPGAWQLWALLTYLLLITYILLTWTIWSAPHLRENRASPGIMLWSL